MKTLAHPLSASLSLLSLLALAGSSPLAARAGSVPELHRFPDPLTLPAPGDSLLAELRFAPGVLEPTEKLVPELRSRLLAMSEDETLPIIVELRSPVHSGGSAPHSAAWDREQRELVALAAHRFARQAGDLLEEARGLSHFPMIFGRATKSAALRLAEVPEVARIFEDGLVRRMRVEGGALIKANTLRSSYGGTGSGVGVAVIDSGVDDTHPELSSRVVVQGDFTGTTGDGTIDHGGHGTACAGIIAGTGGGMAPGAGIWALKVFGPEDTTSDSVIIAALDAAYANRNNFGGLDAVNMSLGGGPAVNSDCDSSSPYDTPFDNLYGAGIALIVASGNDGYLNGVSSPACHSKAIAVGAVYDANVGGHAYENCTDTTTAADQITCYSNSGNPLDVLAPSHDARTTAPGGGYDNTFGGTSAAAPYTAGVAAQLLQLHPGTTPAQLRSAFMSTGKPITDVNGITRNRIDAVAAHGNLGGGGGNPGPCIRDSRTACLLNSRFEVRVTYTTVSSSGNAQVMSFGGARTESDQSVFFYFFDNANFEMGVKMVNACVAPFNKYWAFVSGLTNQGYTVTIRDSITGTTKTYSNPLGSYPQTVGDTSALNCATTPGGEGDAELLGIVPVERADFDPGSFAALDSDSAFALGSMGGGVDLSAYRPAAAPQQNETPEALGTLHHLLPVEDATAANGLDINGEWEWEISSGQVHMRVEDVVNSRGSTTGPLRLTLWASSSPVTGGGTSGYDLGHCNYQALQAGYYYPLMTCDVAYNPPAAGCYYVTILLMEQIDGTWYYQDYASTGQKYPLNGGSCSTTGACVRSSTKACLLGGRFEVTVGYQTASASGAAGVMSFSGQRTESDQSVFFYFFDNANFEMGVKMVDACVDPFNRFWAFVSGLTNQGYIVTVRDTLLDRTKTYSNPLGSYPSTVGDTNAFTCN